MYKRNGSAKMTVYKYWNDAKDLIETQLNFINFSDIPLIINKEFLKEMNLEI